MGRYLDTVLQVLNPIDPYYDPSFNRAWQLL